MADDTEVVGPDAAAIAAAAGAPPEPVVDTPPAVEPAVETPPAAEPGPAPWAKDLEERFADEATRAAVDTYLREKQQPYITKLETERAAALERSWLLDSFDEDPVAALADVAKQLYPEVAERIVELVKGGATPDAAVDQAEAEQVADELTPAKLTPEQEELLAWAKERREAEAADAKSAEEAVEQAEATDFLNDWLTTQTTATPDIKPNTLRAYVVATKGDLDSALAAYREEFPAPEVAPETPPRSLPRAAVGMYSPPRSSGKTADAVGAAWDRLAG